MTIMQNITVFGRSWSLSDEDSGSYRSPVVFDDAGNPYGPVDPVALAETFVRYADEVAFYALQDAARRARRDAGLWTDGDEIALSRKAKEWAPAEMVDLYNRFVAQNPNHPFRR